MKNRKFLLLPLLALFLTGCGFSPFDLLSNLFGDSSEYYSRDDSYYNPSTSYSEIVNESISVISKDDSYVPKKENIDATYKDLCSHLIYSTDSMPSEGTVNVLVIPVWFTDSTEHISTSGSTLTKKNKDQVRVDIRNAFFGDENADDVSWKSVKSYYHDASYGKLNIEGVVTGWYNTNNSVTKYSTSDSTIRLTKDAVTWAKNTYASQIDFKAYDADNNGYLDCVCLIYGYHNSSYKAGGWGGRPSRGNDNLWAYTYWVQEKTLNSKTNPGVNTFLWASYDFMYAEYSGGTNTDEGKVDAHTYIHEMGHCMGLEDYYDYSGKTCPAGAFTMQDYNVGGHDPYSRMALGWVNPYVPTGDCEITINSFNSSGDIILLSPNFANSAFDEYVLLELYTPDGLNDFDSDTDWQRGYPTGSRKSGIRIWHVDSRLLEYKTYPRSEDEGYEISRTLNKNYYYHLGLSNTTYAQGSESYTSISPSLRQYSLLYLVRNSTTKRYPAGEKDYFKDVDLFKQGDTFSLGEFSGQFVNTDKLDNGLVLPFNITVKSLSDTSATITIEMD